MCAGSNPAGGTLYEVPKDPAISAFAEDGVFVYLRTCAAVCRRAQGQRFAVFRYLPSANPPGPSPTGIGAPRAVLVFVSIAETVSEPPLGT